MENNKLFKAVERSTQDIPLTLDEGNTVVFTIKSQKTKYVNGKIMPGVIGVGYTASINNSDYLLKEDKSNNQIQVKPVVDGVSGTCILTQNESGNKINIHLTTPEEWEIRFKPIAIGGKDTSAYFAITTSLIGEEGSMADGTKYKNLRVDKDRHMINVYISVTYPGNFDMLSWSCLDKYGNAFSPNYNIPDNQYFTTKTTGLGSYTITKVSSPSAGNDPTLILPSRFNPSKKCPLDLNFYWGTPVLDLY